jgi:hypothetical protein
MNKHFSINMVTYPMLRPFTIAALASICLLITAPRVDAGVIYGFESITSNGFGSAAIGEAQLSVEVTALDPTAAGGANRVLFTFRNTGTAQSTISQIYFQDGALLEISEVINPSGVNFTGGTANPSNLPGGGTLDPAFVATLGFVAAATNPAPDNGVNPGEQVGIAFDLVGTLGFQDVLNALDLALSTPAAIPDTTRLTLRIGLHVTNFANEASESFINGSGDGGGGGGGSGNNGVVPEPASLAIFGALLGIAGLRRRRSGVEKK